MKICFLNYHGNSGGAAWAALRLFRAIRAKQDKDIDCHFYAVDPGTAPDVETIATPMKRQILYREQQILWKLYGLERSTNPTAHIFNVIRNGLLKRILSLNPDIVHLHSIVGEMLSLGEIAELAKQTIVVWTLHDCWPFTGSEQHMQLGSTRYIQGYTDKNKEHSGIDFDRILFQRKEHLWRDLPIHFIAPSHWIGNCLAQSKLWKNARCTVIGNTYDPAIFHPADQNTARKRLNLPLEKKLLGFGASDLSNPNKGGAELQEVLQRLTRTDSELVTAGNGELPLPGLPVHALGKITDQGKLADFYRSCNLFLSTSKYDNLPNMVLESMACGTPVAAFANGGIPDLVRPDTGLPIKGTAAELAESIFRATLPQLSQLGALAQHHITAHYQPDWIAEQHINLYRSLLAFQGNRQ